MIPSTTQAAPAKINLALHVTRRRDDGYHDLESLIVFADLADELTATPADTDSLTISGPFAAGLGAGSTNLVMRAVTAFRARWPGLVPDGLHIHLVKNLPVAAGIGGGSADAAAALRLLVQISRQNLSVADLSDLAAGLGADVPACLISQPLVARGVGEILSPLPDFPALHIVLINPLVPVATADIFRRLNAHDNYPLPALPSPLTRPAQLGLWLAETRNDLQPPAIKLVPVIGEIIAELAETPGCILARMSGSGATVFGLFGTEGQAHEAAQIMRRHNPEHWVAAAPLLGV
ncbi:MAG: 4-(cytidine 5'-diphospho)-2-C-methyl-D-erythritol kinase [Devosia sp.]|uniref:4-(cytidine 5'-diphospho)-2-C-methyl-D-erythritol kinase n=1 Tax=unclassified Devosia TaxID=196773 RepID=UPI0019FE76E4|nr:MULTISPECIES: 4-(cytidine 5'-diphospho)-2-C-methyl-D-erythritol kinase [unclassified Devosia]MBF0681038.1 4-(cytidine 5'-diphospho)-2-C-methyl-D-erythritol kinase [Devosia sp.]WEJ32485.1 4-(cytidine 5'-diphospho)-2-C-methyl-D-erythritol kinase [Devosia sp. SD17-2]